MSKITNDCLTRSGTGCFIIQLYPYGNSGRQRVKGDELNLENLLKIPGTSLGCREALDTF